MLDVKDMTELIYIHDAYSILNTTLLGKGMVLGFQEGALGAFSRVDTVIQRNAAECLQENDYDGVWEIVNDTSLTPEQRAKLLVEGVEDAGHD